MSRGDITVRLVSLFLSWSVGFSSALAQTIEPKAGNGAVEPEKASSDSSTSSKENKATEADTGASPALNNADKAPPSTTDDENAATKIANNAANRISFFTPAHEQDRPRSVFWAPFFSLFLPGLDQWIEGQPVAASIYTGTNIAAYSVAGFYLRKIRDEEKKESHKKLSKEAQENKQNFNEDYRRAMYSTQVAFATGSFSAYHAFRTAVTTQQKYGRFQFLKNEETPLDILKAPFNYKFLERPTTLIPLAVIGTLAALNLSSDPGKDSDIEKRSLTRSDVSYAGAVSYTAGTHEELLFRGWLMPVLMDQWDSEFWSNGATTLIFALAHLGTTPLPIPQALLGYHLGWVTQRNNWTLSESVFIHTWWDVCAFVMQYQFQKKDPKAAAPTLWLPPFEMHF